MVYFNTAIYMGKINGKSSHLSIFEALTDAFKLHFFRTSFYTLSKTLIACTCSNAAQNFFKVETLLNNAL